MQFRVLPAVALALGVSGCATAASSGGDADLNRALARMMAGQSAAQGQDLEAAFTEAERYPLGSEKNPVRAEMPEGQRAYLARLRCADGNAPDYKRIGSLGFGPYDNIVDGYDVTCVGAEPVQVVMDMYHAGFVESRPVPGFTIEPE